MPNVDPTVLEGTWEEIRGYESRLAGHRVWVTILDPDDTLAVRGDEKFAALAAQWRAETAWTSSVSQMIMHPAYQEIIGMGRDVMPYLLRELERQTERWRRPGASRTARPSRCYGAGLAAVGTGTRVSRVSDIFATKRDASCHWACVAILLAPPSRS